MRHSILLVVTGVVLGVLGFGFAEQSWGWTYGLVAVGAAIVVAAAIRLVRTAAAGRTERATR